jgi:exopolyphosphatase/pppGpp-phosphohydrolase
MVSLDDCKRLEDYLKANPGPHVGVFDIGTRAIRLLVAPRQVPAAEWRRNSFCNVGQILNLGDDLNPESRTIDLADSRKIQELYAFLRTLRGILMDHGVLSEDVAAIGTAVFRWLKNQPDVLEEVARETGVGVTVLSAPAEARLTIEAIGYTYPFRRGPDTGQLDRHDVVLLLDQGGGSMEVSYLVMDGSQNLRTHTFDGLGTIALRQEFFNTQVMDDAPTWVENQIESIQHLIAGKINAWPGYPELAGRRVHAYGMGAAITNCIQGSNYSIHNQVVGCDALLADASRAVTRLVAVPGELKTLAQTLQKRDSSQYLELERLLDRVYGPPVYVRVLKKFALDHLRICGYGLRYGAYVWQYALGRSLQELVAHHQ